MTEPVTKEDVEAIVRAAIESSQLVMLERFEASRISALERLEQTETKLLLEFRKWAVRMDASRRIQEATMVGVTERVQILEERLDLLDKGE